MLVVKYVKWLIYTIYLPHWVVQLLEWWGQVQRPKLHRRGTLIIYEHKELLLTLPYGGHSSKSEYKAQKKRETKLKTNSQKDDLRLLLTLKPLTLFYYKCSGFFR